MRRLGHDRECGTAAACAARCMAAVALARIGPDRAQKELRWAYSNGDALERPFAVLGLGLSLYARRRVSAMCRSS